MSTYMLPMNPAPSPVSMFPLRSLLGHLLQYGERPAIASYITAAKASGDGGFIKEGAGSLLPFTPDDTTLARLKAPKNITRLGAMSHLFSEGIKSLQDTRITIINHLRSFTIYSGGTAIEIQVSMCVEGSGVPCVAWITYYGLSTFYDDIGCRNGLESKYYVPQNDTSDETDPLLVAAHIAIGLYQLQMRHDQLIDPLHKLFKTVVLYLRPGELIGCSTAVMTEEFLRAAKAKISKELEGFHIVYETTPIAVDSPRFKDLLVYIQEVATAQDGTPKPIQVVRKKRRATDTAVVSQSSGATSSG